ncbi:MAG TPA: hypothetical protein VG477_11935, partial [Thermoanaerobaculia bacterium]|nr:hypothetical protein [Thermoanaerobaculia bacterium]
PDMSEGMAALLAISHAAYLANKVRPKSETAPAGGNGGEVNTEAAKARIETAAVERAEAEAEAAKTSSKPVGIPPPSGGNPTQ